MLDWRDGPQVVTVSEENFRQVVEPKKLPDLGAWPDFVAHAIDHPIGSPPLRDLVRPSQQVAILLTDVHDAMFGVRDRVGPMLLDYLNAAGVPDERILLVHAAGLHGHPGAAEKIGPEVLGRVRYHEHDPLDEECLTYHGVTPQGTPVWTNKRASQCDLMVGFGGCFPSLFGFQGGAGIILAGISGADTIRHNHTRMMHPKVITTWWPDNPQRHDVMDTGDLVGSRFKIDICLNTVFAGYFREEWPPAVEYLKENLLVPVKPADIYVLAPAKSPELESTL